MVCVVIFISNNSNFYNSLIIFPTKLVKNLIYETDFLNLKSNGTIWIFTVSNLKFSY